MSRVWLITDSASGAGRTLAEAVLAAGDRLVAGAREPALLADLVAAYGNRVLPVALAVTDEAEVYAALGAALHAFGRLDVVVNPVGHGGVGAVEAPRESDIRDEFETRFFGAVSVAHAALAIMQEQGWGHIVQLPSPIGGRGASAPAAYAAAQAALRIFSLALANEAAPLDVRVTYLEPGSIDPDLSPLLAGHGFAAADAVRSAQASRAARARVEQAEPNRVATADVVPFLPRPVAA